MEGDAGTLHAHIVSRDSHRTWGTSLPPSLPPSAAMHPVVGPHVHEEGIVDFSPTPSTLRYPGSRTPTPLGTFWFDLLSAQLSQSDRNGEIL